MENWRKKKKEGEILIQRRVMSSGGRNRTGKEQGVGLAKTCGGGIRMKRGITAEQVNKKTNEKDLWHDEGCQKT